MTLVGLTGGDHIISILINAKMYFFFQKLKLTRYLPEAVCGWGLSNDDQLASYSERHKKRQQFGNEC